MKNLSDSKLFMVVAISTGCCYDLKFTQQLEAIQFIKKYPVDGIELLFASPKDLFNFKFDEKAFDVLKSLKFVSIHMPFREVIYTNDSQTRELMNKVTNLAKQVNTQYLVFHPTVIKDFDSIRTSIPVCIENMNRKAENDGYCTVNEIQTILEEHPFLGVVLDIAHALGNGINPTDFLTLKNKIRGIHLSGQWIKKGNLKEHGFLTEGTPEQLEKVKEVLKFDVPKVIEADFYPEKILLIEKEIQMLKKVS